MINKYDLSMDDNKRLIQSYEKALKSFSRIAAHGVWAEAQSKLSPTEFIDRVVMPVLTEVGEKWSEGHLPLSQVYMSGRISEELINEILPMRHQGSENELKLGIVTFLDYHTLGKKIIMAVVKAAGYRLEDYGEGLGVDQTTARAEKQKPDILLVSTLMYPSALKIKELKDKMGKVCPKTKIVVGGAPFLFDDKLWQQVGADAMGHSAADILPLLEEMEKEVSK